jgi:hypothetical protein
MMASRGMGAINPSKMPGRKEITRKDDPNKVAMFKRGGKVKKMAEGDVVEEEPTITQKISKQVAEMNKPASEPQEKSLKEASVKPAHVHLSKNYSRVDTKATTGDIPVGEKGMFTAGADASLSAAKGQKAQAKLDRIHGQYAYVPDANTSYGVNVSASPMGEKRLEFGLKKTFSKGGNVWDTPNPAKKHKKLSPAKKAKAKAAAKAAGRPYPNLIDNMREAK